MAYPSYTYTLTNSTTADATQVMQNYNDLLNGISDGTKDISVNALTVAGAATLNGNITLGNATSDDLTATGRWASNLDPKTAATYDHGTSSQTWRAMYLDNGATDSGAIYFDAGTTKFIKGSADGTTLNIGGFVKVNSDSNIEYVGRTNGASGTAGYIGEILSSTVSSDTAFPGASGAWGNAMSLALTPGVWNLSSSMYAARTGATITGAMQHGISTSATAATFADQDVSQKNLSFSAIETGNSNLGFTVIPLYRVAISANTTYYVKLSATWSAGTPNFRGNIQAVRIA